MSQSAEISWLDPQNLGRYGLKRFRIKLRKGKSLILEGYIGKVNEYKLDDLTPFSTYKISVVAGNYRGYSGETVTSFVTLEEGRFLPTTIQLKAAKLFTCIVLNLQKYSIVDFRLLFKVRVTTVSIKVGTWCLKTNSAICFI